MSRKTKKIDNPENSTGNINPRAKKAAQIFVILFLAALALIAIVAMATDQDQSSQAPLRINEQTG